MSNAKIVWKGILVFLGVLAIIVTLTLVSGGLTWVLAPFQGEVEKRQQVEGQGEYRIAKYDKFHNLCQDIQAKNEQIADAKAMLDGDKEKESVYALTQTKNEMVGDYNSMASQDYTAGQFRDSDLPPQIDPNDKEIECG